MAIRISLGVSILARSPSLRASILCALALLSLAVLAAQSRKSVPKAAPKTAPKAAPPAAPASLAALVKAYRESPTAAHKSAVQAWAAAHPKDRPAASLALGIAAYEHHDYSDAIAHLHAAQPGLPSIADYVAYYLAAARVESRDFGGIVNLLAATHSAAPSPYATRARLLEARSIQASSPSDAIRFLREHYSELPQPDGDLLLGEAQQAAGELEPAAATLQKVYLQYVTGDPAIRAANDLSALRSQMGLAFPLLKPAQQVQHATRLIESREYGVARTELDSLADRLVGAERDQTLVLIGAAQFLTNKVSAAITYLKSLNLKDPDAEAERHYYLLECYRRLDKDPELREELKILEREAPKSDWRLRALVSGANHFLIVNRSADFVPLYRAVYQDFPADSNAGLSHWKVAFDSVLRRNPDAESLLKEQLVRYPRNTNSGAALYFLARQSEERRDFASARAYYQSIVHYFENFYYAMLARRRMKQPEIASAAASPDVLAFVANLGLPIARPVPTVPSAATTARIERSRILREAGLADFADAELRFGAHTDGQSPLLGMEMARSGEAAWLGLHHMKAMAPDHLGIPLNQAPRQFWELLYPLPYREELFADARAHGLDPYFVAGLIRQESEFNPAAVSSAKAYGLMQVLPVVGRGFARQAGIPAFSWPMLTQPAVNLKIGTLYLRTLLDNSGGHEEHTLAAYNAGPGRLVEWLGWNTEREPAEFVESIPFTETRDYVQAVMRNADMYRRLYP